MKGQIDRILCFKNFDRLISSISSSRFEELRSKDCLNYTNEDMKDWLIFEQ